MCSDPRSKKKCENFSIPCFIPFFERLTCAPALPRVPRTRPFQKQQLSKMTHVFFVLQGKTRRAFGTREAALASLSNVTKVMEVDDSQSLALLASGELVPIFCVALECASPGVPSPVHRPRCPSSMESTGGALADEDACSPALRSLMRTSPTPLSPMPPAEGALLVTHTSFSTPERKRERECPDAPPRKRLSPRRESLFRTGDMDTNAGVCDGGELHIPSVHRLGGGGLLFVTDASHGDMTT